MIIPGRRFGTVAPTHESTENRHTVVERKGRDKQRSYGAGNARMHLGRRSSSLRFRRAR